MHFINNIVVVRKFLQSFGLMEVSYNSAETDTW